MVKHQFMYQYQVMNKKEKNACKMMEIAHTDKVMVALVKVPSRKYYKKIEYINIVIIIGTTKQ